MKKRLRKKLKKGEFQELGFRVFFILAEADDDPNGDRFWSEFIEKGIEAYGLAFGGGGTAHWDGFVVNDRRGSVSEEQREKVEGWLKGNVRVKDLFVGSLIDAWV